MSPAEWLRNKIPDAFREVGFLIEHWQWLALLALVIVGVIADRVVNLVLSGVARRIFLRFLPKGDPDAVPPAVRPLGLFVMGLIWWGALYWLGLPERVLTVLLVAVKFLTTAAGVWAAYSFADILCLVLADRAARTTSRYDDLLVPLVRKSLKIFIVAFGLVFIADNLNVDITSLLAGLGIGGLAFALAAQDTVKNLFGSLTVLLDRPFRVGDWVVIGGHEGLVEEVGLRSTRIRTFYNSMITLPNSNLIATAVDNLGERRYRRWKAMLSLTYDTPPERIEAFCEGIRELIRRHPHTRKDYFHVYANEYGPASLNILLYVFFRTTDWAQELAERHRLFLDILRLAREVGVEFAFPTQTIHLRREGDGKGEREAVGVEEALEMGREKAKGIVEG
jgi:MscS family membrane protein